MLNQSMKVIHLNKNESELIKRAINSNREAQHVLYEKYAPKMLSVCRYYINDIQKAEEAMLNGFYKVFKNLNQFKNEGSFEGWVRRIMVRESISFIRQDKRIEFPTEKIEPTKGYNDSINSEIEVAQLQQVMDSLPEGYKMVFVMYAIEGYKHREIAALLKITEGTSKSQLYKARQLLQEKINKLNHSNYGTN